MWCIQTHRLPCTASHDVSGVFFNSDPRASYQFRTREGPLLLPEDKKVSHSQIAKEFSPPVHISVCPQIARVQQDPVHTWGKEIIDWVWKGIKIQFCESLCIAGSGFPFHVYSILLHKSQCSPFHAFLSLYKSSLALLLHNGEIQLLWTSMKQNFFPLSIYWKQTHILKTWKAYLYVDILLFRVKLSHFC